MKEYIVCSAIYVNDGIKYENQPINIIKGFCIYGLRHSNCFATLKIFKVDKKIFKEIIQGFLTSKNRFLNRKDSFIIAKESNQIEIEIENGNLFSEHLY